MSASLIRASSELQGSATDPPSLAMAAWLPLLLPPLSPLVLDPTDLGDDLANSTAGSAPITSLTTKNTPEVTGAMRDWCTRGSCGAKTEPTWKAFLHRGPTPSGSPRAPDFSTSMSSIRGNSTLSARVPCGEARIAGGRGAPERLRVATRDDVLSARGRRETIVLHGAWPRRLSGERRPCASHFARQSGATRRPPWIKPGDTYLSPYLAPGERGCLSPQQPNQVPPATGPSQLHQGQAIASAAVASSSHDGGKTSSSITWVYTSCRKRSGNHGPFSCCWLFKTAAFKRPAVTCRCSMSRSPDNGQVAASWTGWPTGGRGPARPQAASGGVT